MKPLKSGTALAYWLLRIALFLFLFTIFYSEIGNFNFHNLESYFAVAFVALGALLFVGGFMAKPTLTVISGILITLLSSYSLFVQFKAGLNASIASFIVVFSIGFYFTCVGNQ